MFVLVDKNTDVVTGMLEQDYLGSVASGLRVRFNIYKEADDTVVSIGNTCTVNQDGSRTYE